MSAVRVLHADDHAEVIHGAGDSYRYLIRGTQSNGQYFVVEGVVPPGGGPPLHVQTREEEAFYILEGEVTFYADGERIVARAGSFVHIPRGVAHRFENEGDAKARMLFWFSPAGIEGMFDKMAVDPDNYASIGPEFGVEFLAED